MLLMLLACGAVTAMAAVVLMAFSLLRPPRMTDGKAVWLLKRLSPGDLGLEFEDVTFQVRDDRGRLIRLAGWWMPHPEGARRCVLILHGYADAKVGAIAWAPVLRALGFNVLAVDLRAHGESGGTYCTGGSLECHDIAQILGQLRAQRPGQTRQMVLFGVSLGAAVAAATAALGVGIDAVVLESPFADYRRAAMLNMDRLGAPGHLFQRLALRLAEWIADADFAAVAPLAQIPQVPCPLMTIQPEDDPGVPPEDREAIAAAIRSRCNASDVVWQVSDTAHLLALHSLPEEYRRRLGKFLERALAVESQVPALGPAGVA